MIFVTVGTHEDPFNRLVESIDRLKKENRIHQDVFIQSGYSTYHPQFCQYKEFISYQEMTQHMENAEMVITHGGTGSIMLVLYHHKIPIVMPRQKKYNEHIDDHQVLFCQTMTEKRKIIAAFDSDQLHQSILNYHQTVTQLLAFERENENQGDSPMNLEQKSARFADKLDTICHNLMEKKNPK